MSFIFEVLKHAFVRGLVILLAGSAFGVVLYLTYKAVCNGVELLIPYLGEPAAFFSLLVLLTVTGFLSIIFLVRVVDAEFSKNDRKTIDN